MPGYFSIVLHAHLPFVRHPEHEKFLEESWLYEAVAECYLPLIQVLEGWSRDNMDVRITLTLSPTLCAMLRELGRHCGATTLPAGIRVLVIMPRMVSVFCCLLASDIGMRLAPIPRIAINLSEIPGGRPK